MIATKQKVTFTTDKSVVEAINELKKQYGFKSVSAVISEAVSSYKKQKRIEKWRNSYKAVMQNPEWIKEEVELANLGDNTYYEEYWNFTKRYMASGI